MFVTVVFQSIFFFTSVSCVILKSMFYKTALWAHCLKVEHGDQPETAASSSAHLSLPVHVGKSEAPVSAAAC